MTASLETAAEIAPSDVRWIELAPNLDITHAGALAEELRKHDDEDVAVDASAVERLGTQVVQVLLSAAKTRADSDLSFSVAAPSNAFLNGLELLGLTIADFSTDASSNMDEQQ